MMHAPLKQSDPLVPPELDEISALAARMNFATYRRTMWPDMLWGWWTENVAGQLQRFYDEFEAGKRPKLVLQAPVQHGKSWAVTDFMS